MKNRRKKVCLNLDLSKNKYYTMLKKKINILGIFFLCFFFCTLAFSFLTDGRVRLKKKCFDRFLRYKLSKEEIQAETLQNMKNNITDLKNFIDCVLLNEEKTFIFLLYAIIFWVAMKFFHTETCQKCLISNLMKLIHKYNIRHVHIFR